MTGRITRLIDDEQIGTIAGEDGADYQFSGRSLLGVTFGSLHLGLSVMFTPAMNPRAPQAMSVRVSPK